MATKKQKAGIPKRALVRVDKSARSIEAALEALDPPLDDDVHQGIVRLIAEFAEAHVCFGEGGGRAYFDISDDRMTATYNTKYDGNGHFICASPSFIDGTHETTFRITKGTIYDTIVAVVPAANAPRPINVYSAGGYLYNSAGDYFDTGGKRFDMKFDLIVSGDAITVRLDLDASTIAFRKNGTEVGAPQKIVRTPGNAHHFAFQAWSKGDAATIVE